jgi:hypothetical protein
LRADEERLGVVGVFSTELDEADGGAGRERGEEVFGVGCVKLLAGVEIEHGRRILRERTGDSGVRAAFHGKRKRLTVDS